MFQVFLAWYSGQEDVVVSSETPDRDSAEAKSLIGLSANTVLLRARLDGNPTFGEVEGRAGGAMKDTSI